MTTLVDIANKLVQITSEFDACIHSLCAFIEKNRAPIEPRPGETPVPQPVSMEPAQDASTPPQAALPAPAFALPPANLDVAPLGPPTLPQPVQNVPAGVFGEESAATPQGFGEALVSNLQPTGIFYEAPNQNPAQTYGEHRYE